MVWLGGIPFLRVMHVNAPGTGLNHILRGELVVSVVVSVAAPALRRPPASSCKAQI